MATESMYIISPRQICQTCGNPSGPNFSATPFVHPSQSAIHRSQQVLSGPLRQSKTSEIEEMELELNQLGREIDSLEGSLKALKSRREELKRHLHNEKSLLSPIRLIDDDLLGEIFIMSQNGIRKAVINLEEVCIHWRVVAQSTPRLWSEIGVPSFQYNKPKNLQQILTLLLRRCIQLSREAPLTLRFPQHGRREIVQSLVESGLQDLAACAHRLAVVEYINIKLLRAVLDLTPKGTSLIQLTSLTITSIHGSLTIPSSPNLVELTVYGLDNITTQAKISFEFIPSLKIMNLGELDHPYGVFPRFPWGQITDFISQFNVNYQEEQLKTIMHAMTNLSSLTFCGETMATSSIILPQVRFFSTDLKVMRLYSDILDILILPNLRILHLNTYSRLDNVIGLLRRSECKLQQLRLHGSLCVKEIWKGHELRHIQKLTITRVYDPKHIRDLKWLSRLSFTDDDETIGGADILPILEVLEILELKLTEYSQLLDLIDIVKSRLRKDPAAQEMKVDDTATYLKEFTVDFKATVDETSLHTWIKFCQSEIARASGVVLKTLYKGKRYL